MWYNTFLNTSLLNRNKMSLGMSGIYIWLVKKYIPVRQYTIYYYEFLVI